jgi:hypothetical protein
MRPAALFDALARKIEGIPDGANIAMIGGWRSVRVWILSEQ